MWLGRSLLTLVEESRSLHQRHPVEMASVLQRSLILHTGRCEPSNSAVRFAILFQSIRFACRIDSNWLVMRKNRNFYSMYRFGILCTDFSYHRRRHRYCKNCILCAHGLEYWIESNRIEIILVNLIAPPSTGRVWSWKTPFDLVDKKRPSKRL